MDLWLYLSSKLMALWALLTYLLQLIHTSGSDIIEEVSNLVSPVTKIVIVTLIAVEMGIPATPAILNASFATLGMDSLDLLNLLMKVEMALRITIGDGDCVQLTTVQQLIDLVQRVKYGEYSTE